MSAVFLMQPLGQFCAYAVGLAVLHALRKPYELDAGDDGLTQKVGIDVVWRIVAGVGGVPALIALLFRWTIPVRCMTYRWMERHPNDLRRSLVGTPVTSSRTHGRRFRIPLMAPLDSSRTGHLTMD